ncbi:energy-coupling factor ABC transporter ATP-binding protein [Sedimenticola thiotaurini]|uniref:energy-coupling factor ABC transporter ATP-binding protein n=1 Tax=Sedimenticola thiotaurini TaxID=1543721 RepID=UPI0006999BB9|nr:energy-coupling factor ABC transporter ATP-binding protein [Sedimenticola thiotaurini]
MTSANPWLKLQHLTFNRGERTILKDLSLEFRSGELILLTGQNGSGKTTLLRILAGLLKPGQVRFEIEGKQRNWRQTYHYLREQVCYLHQQPYLFDSSVSDNIAYGLKRKKMARRAIRSRVAEALELISLEHLAERNCQELSGGEKQRVAIARAWAISPRLMLLDEPVSNLDKRSREISYDLINQLQQQQIGVVYTSHEPQTGKLRLNRHIHLYDGELTTKPLQNNYPPGIIDLEKERISKQFP